MKNFASFLKSAKAAAPWDAPAGAKPCLPGAVEWDYKEPGWWFKSLRFGSHFLVGQEVVYRDEVPFWAQSYQGGLLPGEGLPEPAEVWAFLHKALQKPTEASPYRGPAQFKDGDWLYRCEWMGKPVRFQGSEDIFCKGQPVFRLTFGGGLL